MLGWDQGEEKHERGGKGEKVCVEVVVGDALQCCSNTCTHISKFALAHPVVSARRKTKRRG